MRCCCAATRLRHAAQVPRAASPHNSCRFATSVARIQLRAWHLASYAGAFFLKFRVARVPVMRCMSCGGEMLLAAVVSDDVTMPAGFRHETLQCTVCGDTERRFVFGRDVPATSTVVPAPASPKQPAAPSPRHEVAAPPAAPVPAEVCFRGFCFNGLCFSGSCFTAASRLSVRDTARRSCAHMVAGGREFAQPSGRDPCARWCRGERLESAPRPGPGEACSRSPASADFNQRNSAPEVRSSADGGPGGILRPRSRSSIPKRAARRGGAAVQPVLGQPALSPAHL
jgi:hypothetical protein